MARITLYITEEDILSIDNKDSLVGRDHREGPYVARCSFNLSDWKVVDIKPDGFTKIQKKSIENNEIHG